MTTMSLLVVLSCSLVFCHLPFLGNHNNAVRCTWEEEGLLFIIDIIGTAAFYQYITNNRVCVCVYIYELDQLPSCLTL
ncbi:hypothetical protein BDB00DRAFT_818115 [Zychaea mexicana]|uniref:uncharacterized protein n=1 Tax=Zychaea mexicana TaxID=64656 RepID=UPI0022FE9758|nr:uncharacterized protein BDB00DRAFT_818115 [Zychaea mexicana]KAI9494455.1 hypothetical protein BDB00DRAFT_818115 [Zychaea mexicana]